MTTQVQRRDVGHGQGYPAEPAARSRPFGRVSLAPPFADAHCALRLPGGSLRSPPLPGRHPCVEVRPHRPLARRVLLAPCSRVRTSADSATDACLPVLRTTPCSTRCTSRRSSAAAAPMSRRRRRRFPELRCCSIGRPDRRGGLGSHTRRILDAGIAKAVHVRSWLPKPRSRASLSAPVHPCHAGKARTRLVAPVFAAKS